MNSERLLRGNLLSLLLLLLLLLLRMFVANAVPRVCRGTTDGQTVQLVLDPAASKRAMVERYRTLEQRYTGCEYVETSLEISGFVDPDDNMDFAFLKDIKEVFGYVLISAVNVKTLPLDNLEIIHGHLLFNPSFLNESDKSYIEEYFESRGGGNVNLINEIIADNSISDKGLIGSSLIIFSSMVVKEKMTIFMPKLKEISNGNIQVRVADDFCFLKNINWSDLFNDPNEQQIRLSGTRPSHESITNSCPSCHQSCRKDQGCWGKKKIMCQNLTRTICNERCENRCVIGHPDVCCHPECSGGCTSTNSQHCTACKNVMIDGECASECPRHVVYDTVKKKNVPNPHGRYNLGKLCVKKCPDYMFVEDNSCVTLCGKGYKIDFDRSLCLPCTNDCPLFCESPVGSLKGKDMKSFVNCSIVQGAIRIDDLSFNSEIDLKALENVQLVTDFVYVGFFHNHVTDLSFLKNLKIIQGQKLHSGSNSSLLIYNTSLKELGLNSLKKVIAGEVVIQYNKDLCYVNTLPWAELANGKHRIFRPRDSASCESDGYVCSKSCNPKKGCMGPGNDQCLSCAGLMYQELCLSSCHNFSYSAPLYSFNATSCSRCHDQCVEGCQGPNSSQCWACANFVWNSTCVEECPAEMSHNSRFECVNHSQLAVIGTISALAGLALICLLIATVLFYKKQMSKSEEKKLILAAQLNGIMECEPLNPTSIKPNMSKLRLIKESELRCGGIIGSGAFGTVFKGLWVPEGENLKIPVAIKVLQSEGEDESGRPLIDKDQENQILEEARIMASVTHCFCMHILAFCMGRKMMIVSQFMPHGSLLEYIRHKGNIIGSKHMLNWCSQIAKGMEYLEERKIIHRDLAARNVLVQTPNHIRIIDFGLAKLVEDDDKYLSEGGKLPIKWLALECIREKIFTHKSDVWSFGVTIWEVCTYGQRPYEVIPMQDLVAQLEKGERLAQPLICTIDVYMVMIKCWLVDADARPTFKGLAETFTQMAHDPGRYLVIESDELKKIPSETFDTMELLRTMDMGSQEGGENFITADKYLQLKKHPSYQATSANDLHKEEVQNNYTKNSKKRPDITLKINSVDALEEEAPPSSGEPRYTPDPTTYPNKEKLFTCMTLDKTDADYRESTENYLIPRSKGQLPYLELINECDSNFDLNQLSSPGSSCSPEGNSLLKASSPPVAVQNPEYFADEL